MILGLIEPTSGDAQIDGYAVSQSPDEVKRRIGFVSTSVGVYPWLTPKEVLLFVADHYGMDRAEAGRRAEMLSELLSITDIMNRRCSVLSTGQRQRMNLARALMHDPPVMLMDEPTRGLDVVGSQVIFDYIVHLREQGKAVIVCTHRLDEAERFCDSFGLMHRGSVRHLGTLNDLRQQTSCDTLTDMFLALLGEEGTGNTVGADS